MNKAHSILIIGGGAAGFFAAISAKRTHPNATVTLIEKNSALLSKVRVSGGGRCNVTHACFDPRLLSKNYPRGEKELLGPFHHFQPKDTCDWFESRGVPLKTEEDGRIFPVSDSSQSIIDCLLAEAKKLSVSILQKQKIETISKNDKGFSLQMKDGSEIFGNKLILATGSSLKGHVWSQALGHSIQPPVPSLFTFNIPHFALKELSGISFKNVAIRINETSFEQTGALLITHFGLSGPCVLKLSAWAARALYEKEYSFEVLINWLPGLTLQTVLEKLNTLKRQLPHKTLVSENLFKLPKNFWKKMLKRSNGSDQKRLNDLSSKDLNLLASTLTSDTFQVKGKTTNKEEFVTCGGVTLKEVNFKTMESKICPGLFFAGEILDIDGVTGGFNFQNAWTTGFIAGSSTTL